MARFRAILGAAISASLLCGFRNGGKGLFRPSCLRRAGISALYRAMPMASAQDHIKLIAP